MIASQPIAPLNTGVATVNVIADFLESFDVLQLPENRKRRVAWASPFLEKSELHFPVAENLVCFVLDSENVLLALEEHPMALGILVLDEDELLPEVLVDGDNPIVKRLFVAKRRSKSLSITDLLALLQTRLFELYRWNARSEEIVRWSGSIQALLDASSELLVNWIDVTDATYTLLANSHNMEPPDALSKNLVDLGCHSAVQVKAARDAGVFGEWTEQAGIGIFDPIELVPFEHVTYVIRRGKVYRGHVVMVCNEAHPTAGLVDLFEEFARHCERLVLGEKGNVLNRAPYEGFLTHLLNNKSPRQDYVENQRAIAGIEDSSTFCFAIIDNSGGTYDEQSLLVLSSAKAMLPNSLVMLHEDSLVVLFHAPSFNPGVISEQMSKLESFCTRYECIAFRSTVFSAIEDLHYANLQAKKTRQYRYAIENSLIFDNDRSHGPIYRFQEAFVFLAGESDEESCALLDFVADNSHLDIIARLQLENSVSDLKMLYHYLVSERKATPTAEQLHMHRNNVLHRIKTIEKKYYLDLDDYFTRQYLLICFRMKINRSAEFRKKLL